MSRPRYSAAWRSESAAMCTHSHTKGQQANPRNSPGDDRQHRTCRPMPGIFPDYPAPIVRNTPRAAADAGALGHASSKKALLDAATSAPDKLQRRARPWIPTCCCAWRPTVGPPNSATPRARIGSAGLARNRCLVPFTSPGVQQGSRRRFWFAFNEERPFAFFAGNLGRTGRACGKVREARSPRTSMVFDHGPECRGQRHPSQGDAGHSDDGGGARRLAPRASIRGLGATSPLPDGYPVDRRERSEEGRRGGVRILPTLRRRAWTFFSRRTKSSFRPRSLPTSAGKLIRSFWSSIFPVNRDAWCKFCEWEWKRPDASWPRSGPRSRFLNGAVVGLLIHFPGSANIKRSMQLLGEWFRPRRRTSAHTSRAPSGDQLVVPRGS